MSQFLLFAVSVLFLALAVFVYRSGPHSPIHRWFAAFVACAATWTFGIAGRQWGTHLELWNDIAFASASLLPATFFGFTYVFPTRPSRIPAAAVTASVVVGAALAVLSAATSLIYYEPVVTAEGFARKSGRLYPVYAVYILVVWVLALTTLFAKWRGARGVARVQLRYVAWAFLLSGIGGLTTNLILPWMTGQSRYSWFGPYFGVVLIGLIAHTIIRHRLMDMRLVIHRSLAGGIAAFSVLIPVAIIVWLLWPRLTDRLDGIELLILVGAVFAVGLVSPLARAAVAQLLDRYVYRTHANYQRTVKQVSTGLTRVLNINDLLSVLTTTLREAVKPEGLAIYAAQDLRLVRVADMRLSEWRPFGAPHELPRAVADDLASTRDAIATDHHQAVGGGLKPHAAMHELNWAVVLPLLAEDKLIGAIAIGPKVSGDPFYKDDLGLLMTLANQAGVALQNAQRYADVVLAHEYVARIVASISSGVVAVDKSERISLLNEAAAALCGLALRDVTDHRMVALPRPVRDALRHALSEGVPISVPETDMAVPVTLTAGPVRDLSGAIVGAVCVLSDLTPIRELELERRKAEKLAYFEMLASGVAHEVKNPLVAIKAFVQLLPRRQHDSDWMEKFERISLAEIARIEKLLDRLRALGQPSDRPRVRLDFRGPITEAVDTLQPLVAEKAVQLDVRLPADPVTIVADHDGLKQLVLNLLLNAHDATPPGGAVTVELSPDSNVAVLTVVDTGDGIPTELFGKMFEPFVTTKSHGTGLGLAISAGMAAIHGGSLRGANEPAGGARFTLTLPLATTEPKLLTA